MRAVPFLITTAAVIAGSIGVKDTIESFSLSRQAKEMNSEAEAMMNHAVARLDYYRQSCNATLENLGMEKLQILNLSVRPFVDLFSHLRNVDFRQTQQLMEVFNLELNTEQFNQLVNMSHEAAVLLSGGIGGIGGGALCAMGAYAGVKMLGYASTGTAIHTLHGIALKNATLAWFGGGSLASGGLGMAGGMAVLGGAVAGPALLIFGTITKNRKSKDLENAKANMKLVETSCMEYENGCVECLAVSRKAALFMSMLAQLDSMFMPMLFEFENIVARRGLDYQYFSYEERELVAKAFSLAFTIKKVLDTNILTDDGSLNPMTYETERIAQLAMTQA